MRQLTSIVAMNAEGAIGAANHLPWRVRSDLQFFRQQTLDQVVIMGRKTHDSLGGCLPRRTNIVVTHGFSLFPSSADCHSVGAIDEALVTADYRAKRRDIFVIGGATMYEQFAPFVDRYLITRIDKDVPEADAFFRSGWMGDQSDWNSQIIAEGKADGQNDEADFQIWELVPKDPRVIAARRAAAIEAYRRRAAFHSTKFATAHL